MSYESNGNIGGPTYFCSSGGDPIIGRGALRLGHRPRFSHSISIDWLRIRTGSGGGMA